MEDKKEKLFDLIANAYNSKSYNNVEVKEGTETMKFSLKAETTAQVGAKVNEFNASNTVKINEMSEQDMNIIYGRLMQKLQPIMSQIMPGMNAANFRQKLTK